MKLNQLRMFSWLLLPLLMGALAYLFLLPPPERSQKVTGKIALIILDPISLKDFDENLITCPSFSNLRNNGIAVPYAPTETNTVKDATLEILTGKSHRKLPRATFDIDPETYSPIQRSIDQFQSFTIQEIIRRIAPEKQQEIHVIHLRKNEMNSDQYIAEVEKTIDSFKDTVSTWMITCPSSQPRSNLSLSWNIDDWLHENGFLKRNDDGTVDFSRTQVFFAGGCEAGLRINRDLTYGSGVVMRNNYRELRKTVVETLGQVKMSDIGAVDSDQPVFKHFYPGERIFSERSEGAYPDIVWEKNDVAVEITGGLLPSHCFSEPGWVILNGPDFDHQLQDKSRLEHILPVDIAPTVLYLLRLPVAEDMDGRVLRPAMKAEQHQRMPETVESYSVEDPLVEQNF